MTCRELGNYEDKGHFLERLKKKNKIYAMFKGLKSFVHSHYQCLAPLSILNMHVIVEFGKFGVGVQVQISEKKNIRNPIFILEPSSMRELVLAHLSRKLK